jgi:hypothetical protein
MRITYLALCMAFCACSCTAPTIITDGKKQSWSLNYSMDAPNDVAILKRDDSVPTEAVRLGTTKISIPRFGGFEDGQLDLHLMSLAMIEARRKNGNMIRIIHTSMGQQLEAEIYSVNGPLPPAPARGKCNIHLHLEENPSPPFHGNLYFNDSLLVSYPSGTSGIKDFTVDSGGFLVYSWDSSKFCEGVMLQGSGDYQIQLSVSWRHVFYLAVVPWEMYFPKSIPRGSFPPATSVPPSPTTSVLPSFSGGNCIVHLKGEFPNGLTGGLYFNGHPLLSFPLRTTPREEYSFTLPSGGVLAYRATGSFDVNGAILKKGEEYYVRLRQPARQRKSAIKFLSKNSFRFSMQPLAKGNSSR